MNELLILRPCIPHISQLSVLRIP